MPTHRKIQLRLYGAFQARWSDGGPIKLGEKHRGLLAMLATAAGQTHSRVWIQDTLWTRASPEQGRGSLRRALSDIKKIIGAEFEQAFVVDNFDIALNPDWFEIQGDRRDGVFLQGLDIREEGFETWLRDKRSAPSVGGMMPVALSADALKPVVAIIPFTPLQSLPQEAHFCDLFAQEVTRSLSRSRLIDVISHLSARQFSDDPQVLTPDKNPFGLDYFVYGSVSQQGDRFHANAQMCHLKTGKLLWTLDTECTAQDIAGGEIRSAGELAAQVGRSILNAATELAQTQPLPLVDSHALLMSAVAQMHGKTVSEFSNARELLGELISRFPANGSLKAWLSKWYILWIAQGWSTNVQGDVTRAADLANEALDLDPQDSFSLAIYGMVQTHADTDFSESEYVLDDATRIDPNNSLAWLLKARLNAFQNQGTQAVKHAKRAKLLSPLDPYAYFYDMLSATAHLTAGDYQTALDLADRSYKQNRYHTSTLRVKAVTLQLMGRGAEASEVVDQLLLLEPGLTVSKYLKTHPAAELETGQLWSRALKDAGMPVS